MGDYGAPTISSMMAGECDESYDTEDRHRQLREAARRNQMEQLRELPRKNDMVLPKSNRDAWHHGMNGLGILFSLLDRAEVKQNLPA